MKPRLQPEMMNLTGKRLEAKGYLDSKEVERIASRMRIPSSRVYGFASQFGEFPLRPYKARLRVCTGPACAETGSWAVLEELARRAPQDILVTAEAGILRWHSSPAVGVDVPGEGAWLAEGLAPADVDALVSAVEKSDFSSWRPLSGVMPPSPTILPGNDPSPWSIAAAEGALPDAWGPELIAWAAGNAAVVEEMLEECGTTAGVREEKGYRLGALVCDAVGYGAENSVSFAACLLHPRAVVAGAAVAAAASAARELVFYLPWNEPQVIEAVESAAGELLSESGMKYSIITGPAHVPCSLDIGRAAILRGIMLWNAASLYGWDGTLQSDLPLAVITAEMAWRLPWIKEGEAGTGRGWTGNRLFCLGGGEEGPQLLEVAPGTGIADVLEGAGVGSSQGDYKAVHLVGAPDGDSLRSWDKAGLVEVAEGAMILDTLDCIPRWALYLAWHAERGCCGGCAPGRTAPAAIARLIQEVLKGEAGEEDMRRLRSLVETSGELALCPQLEKVLKPIASCLSEFEDEFEAHAVDGSCRAGSCAPAVGAAT